MNESTLIWLEIFLVPFLLANSPCFFGILFLGGNPRIAKNCSLNTQATLLDKFQTGQISQFHKTPPKKQFVLLKSCHSPFFSEHHSNRIRKLEASKPNQTRNPQGVWEATLPWWLVDIWNQTSLEAPTKTDQLFQEGGEEVPKWAGWGLLMLEMGAGGGNMFVAKQGKLFPKWWQLKDLLFLPRFVGKWSPIWRTYFFRVEINN